MEEGENTPDALRERLNKKLEISSSYVAVKVLTAFWNVSDDAEKYREEGQQLGQFLREKLGFLEVDQFPIPELNPQRRLQIAVSEAMASVEEQSSLVGGPGLLIIHYGGHGDPDDDKHAGGQGRAVWRAFRKGGPCVEWYKIQDGFEDTKLDVLLLLDCCFSAQAARGPDRGEGRIEILAAAGRREETPVPGPRSFTNGLIREMESLLKDQDYVIISELHVRLSNRRSKLYSVPYHFLWGFGPSAKSIRLEASGSSPAEKESEDWDTAVRIMIRMTEGLNDARINRLCLWLREDGTGTVTDVRAEEVIFKTARINRFIQEDLSDRTKPLVRGLEKPDLDTIRSAWANIQGLISQYTAQKQSLTLAYTRSELAQSWPRQFLEELDKGNSKIVETLEQSVLLSDEYSKPAMIQQAIDDPSAELLGIKDHLQLRHIVCSGLGKDQEQDVPRVSGELPEGSALQEYKTYGENQSDAEIQDIQHRVGLLAKVLGSEKSEDFRALRLCHWEHRKFEYHFVYQFKIPAMYGEHHQTLYDSIKHPWNKIRPSLGQRFDMARRIANAVQHWHSVGWVHQGICSHNIIFFVGQDQKLDYPLPYLQGFDFSRPNLKPSLARYVEDINFDVYRHPDRQGPSRSGHRKTHDLYSLGVVLLEIGLWRRAIDIIIDAHGKKRITKEEMQQILIEAAETRLPLYAGSKYQRAVLTCLQSDFGVTFDDESGSRLAVAVREKVVDRIYGGEDID